MKRIHPKQAGFEIIDEATATNVPGFDETTSYKPKKELTHHHHASTTASKSAQPLKAIEYCSDIADLVLKHYGEPGCVRPEIDETRTQTSEYALPSRVTEIPSDESFSDIIDLVLKVYGNQADRSNVVQKTIQESTKEITSQESSTTDLNVAFQVSHLTQTNLLEHAEMFTNTREIETSFGILKEVCFRFFFGPSLDETGVSFRENFPMIYQFFNTLKAMILGTQTDADESAVSSVESSNTAISFNM